MALAERKPALPEVTINLSTHQFRSDQVTTTFKEGMRWRTLLFLASRPLQKILKEEFSEVIRQAGGKNFDHPYGYIDRLRGFIEPDKTRPLIVPIKGTRYGGREVLGYSFLASVNLIGQEQPVLPKKAEPVVMDAEEFSSLYEGRIGKTRRSIYYRLGNREDAADLAQDVYLNAWKANIKGDYKPTPAGPLPWIHQITHNRLVNHYHYQETRRTVSLEGMDIPAFESSDPAFLLERQFTSGRLPWAISKLSKDQRDVVMARYIGEMNLDEIAKEMSKSKGNVKVILHRAIRRLRILLAEDSSRRYQEVR